MIGPMIGNEFQDMPRVWSIPNTVGDQAAGQGRVAGKPNGGLPCPEQAVAIGGEILGNQHVSLLRPQQIAQRYALKVRTRNQRCGHMGQASAGRIHNDQRSIGLDVTWRMNGVTIARAERRAVRGQRRSGVGLKAFHDTAVIRERPLGSGEGPILHCPFDLRPGKRGLVQGRRITGPLLREPVCFLPLRLPLAAVSLAQTDWR